MSDSWTVYDQIEQLQGKYNLRDRDRRAYYEWAENHIRQNEGVLVKLRQENRGKRMDLSDSINGDAKVIKQVFQNRPTEKLALQRKNAVNAIEVMDFKTCELAKTLNGLRHERATREEKIKELKFQLDKITEARRKPTPEQLESEQRIRQLENSLDKATMKFQTATNIKAHYEAILRKMRQESMSFPAKLEATEGALRDQIQELKELRVMAAEAKEARDKTKAMLTTTEQTVYESRKKRDQNLNRTRKEVEHRKEEAERIQKQAQRATLNFADPLHEQRLAHEAQQTFDRQRRILTKEQAIERIKEATGLSDPQDFVSRFEGQDSTREHLTKQQNESEILRNRLRETKLSLLEEFNELRYSGEKRGSKTRQMIEEATTKMEELEMKSNECSQQVRQSGELLVDVKSGVGTLMDMVKHVRLPPPSMSKPSGDILEDLGLMTKKLETLKAKALTPSKENLKRSLSTQEFYDFLEMNLPADNIRIKISDSTSSIESFDFEGQDDENVFSRDDIKKQGQQLLDFKLKPKKRRPKKK
ncbi:outer dynein arm-docking complex subunit 3-like [Tubulanus polymorphus]|uniref:outer dynein arm-docking complex subunit 3-like n=1 Tax=Tubulanus polymorphus TaxID=672921 RepID=UPI003DA5EADC